MTAWDRPTPVDLRRDRRTVAIQVLTWWTDRQPAPTRSTPRAATEAAWTFEIPGQPSPTAVHYFFSSPARLAGCAATAAQPAVHFITADPLRDPGRHGDLLDVFGVARLAAPLVWRTPVPNAERLDATRDGILDMDDLRAAGASLLSGTQPAGVEPLQIASSVEEQDGHEVLRFVDGSTLRVPCGFDGSYTDIETSWRLGYLPLQRVRPMSHLLESADLNKPAPIEDTRATEADVNRVFYRAEPDSMHRYMSPTLKKRRNLDGWSTAGRAAPVTGRPGASSG